jgi:molybdopterin/thiamine biosynthesis adenylyltransferase
MADAPRPVPGRSVALIGLGAIGSFAVSHLARLPDVRRVVLIDPDQYEPRNALSQDIDASDVGRPKAGAQAERLARMAPGLGIDALVARVESVPLGLLRTDLVLAGLDSGLARQALNERLWRLGVPWIDAGIESSSSLARVSAFAPEAGAACFECAWDDRAYRRLAQAYSCAADSPPPTRATSGLAALAAALQALVAREAWTGHPVFGRQLVLDAAHHHVYSTALRRNPACRFDHERWSIEPLSVRPEQLTLEDLFGLAPAGAGGPRMSVPGSSFVRRLACAAGCGAQGRGPYLRAALGPGAPHCRCGAALGGTGFDEREALSPHELSPAELRSRLDGLGLRPGELIRLEREASARHVELAGAARAVAEVAR